MIYKPYANHNPSSCTLGRLFTPARQLLYQIEIPAGVLARPRLVAPCFGLYEPRGDTGSTVGGLVASLFQRNRRGWDYNQVMLVVCIPDYTLPFSNGM